MVRLGIALIVGAVLAGACGNNIGDPTVGGAVLQARNLEPGAAQTDAERAIRQGDHRLLAVAGFSLEIPGTQLSASEAEAHYGIREIEGTSDMLDSSEAARFNANARAYAETYNRTIIRAFPNPRGSVQ